MMLPRLIVADEIHEGKTPMSLLLIQALRNKKVPLNVFFCARKEEDLRLMSLMSDVSVSCLDAYTMSSPRNLKTLFQRRASPDALNIISVPLGMAIDAKTFQTFPEGPELAKILNCGVIPILAASTVAVISAATALSVLSSFDEIVPDRVLGIVFSSMKNPREFQLLEKEFNRRTATLTLGFTPSTADCAMPSMRAMSSANPALPTIPVKSAALQLGGHARQIDWQLLEAFSYLDAEWAAPEGLNYQSRHMSVAVVGAPASLEGEGNLEVFRLMGCDPQPYDHRKDPFPIGADVLYLPHMIDEPYIEELLSDPKFREGMLASVRGNKLILATGASALLFGASYRTSDQRKIDGLKLFPYNAIAARDPHARRAKTKRVEMRGIGDTCFTANNEKMRGYAVGGFTISNPGNLAAPCLSYRDMREDVESGLSGWANSHCFVTDLRLDLWSALDTVHRWLGQRQRIPRAR